MIKRQQTVCAIALFSDGYSFRQIAEALEVDIEQAKGLVDAGAEAQRRGDMVYMPNQNSWNCRDSEIYDGEALEA